MNKNAAKRILFFSTMLFTICAMNIYKTNLIDKIRTVDLLQIFVAGILFGILLYSFIQFYFKK